MSTNPTQDEVRQSIVVNSDQLNAEDLLTGPVTVTITGVRRGTKEQPIFIEMEGYAKTFRPCKTVRRILIAMWSDDPNKWIGQRLTLFCDPSILFGGVRVGGLRVSHATGLANPRTFLLTQTRGKKAEVTIQPLAASPPEQQLSPEDQSYVDGAKASIASAESLEVLAEIGTVLKEASKASQAALRGPYKARKVELEAEQR